MKMPPLLDREVAQGRAALRAAFIAGLLSPAALDDAQNLHALLHLGLLHALPTNGDALQAHVSLTDTLDVELYFSELPDVVIGPGETLLAEVHPLFLPSVIARLSALPRLPMVFSPLSAYGWALDQYVGDEHLRQWRTALAQRRGGPEADLTDEQVWAGVQAEGSFTRPQLQGELGVWASAFRPLSWAYLARLARPAIGQAGLLARQVWQHAGRLRALHAQIDASASPAQRPGAPTWAQEFRQFAFGMYRAGDDLVQEFHGEADECLHNHTRGYPTAEIAVSIADLAGAQVARRSLFAYVLAHEAWGVLLEALTARGVIGLSDRSDAQVWSRVA